MGYDLKRFIKAQELDYEQALSEIKSGRKKSHWIWYIFPQLQGLGFSYASQYYGIEDIGEARAYMADSVLRTRLLEISDALLGLNESNPSKVMGYPDDLKLQSSMTLFAIATPECDIFQKVLDKYFHGEQDQKTVQILKGKK